jgi:inner membrane protein
MQKTLFLKILMVLGLMALIGIPLAMIQATISGRMQYHAEAVNSIAADSVREQSMIGPVLVLPYTDEFEEEIEVGDAKTPKTKIVTRSLNKRQYVFPNDLTIKGSIDTDQRYRGIHKVLVYTGQYAVAGDFTLPKTADLARDNAKSRITLGKPFVALAIDDVRGIRNLPKINWGGQTYEFEQSSGLHSYPSGMHARLGEMALLDGVNIKFSFDFGLDGIERQHFSPVGKNNVVNIKSNWPHPQFSGRFLPSPKNRTIDDKGFNVNWNISSLATNVQPQLLKMEHMAKEVDKNARVAAGELDHFSVGFIEPINIYSQADRATKYGLMFIALTFAAFFVFEVLKRLPIHPVQYLLVGMALVIFFLLLLSLSEKLAFWLAYLLASSGCIVLIGFYLSHVLQNRLRGLAFAFALTVLYGVLYGLLNSESNALMMGSILLFAVLAGIMVATRKVNWYQLGKPGGEAVVTAA